MKQFDRKFGDDFISCLPAGPAVYLFKDDADRIIYVGKAKNVRRRLASYRNASRRKVHRKMRDIVRNAANVEIRPLASEREALATENVLIREHRPQFNVDGTYTFLYPAFGVRRTPARTLLCFTTDVDAWSAFGLRWFGTFRSRLRSKDAFHALVELLSLVGHRDPRRALGRVPDLKGSALVGVRQLDARLVTGIETFLAGASPAGLRQLVTALLDKPRARREAASVQALLELLDGFYRTDLAPLHAALATAGIDGTFVPQDERDLLFILGDGG